METRHFGYLLFFCFITPLILQIISTNYKTKKLLDTYKVGYKSKYQHFNSNPFSEVYNFEVTKVRGKYIKYKYYIDSDSTEIYTSNCTMRSMYKLESYYKNNQ